MVEINEKLKEIQEKIIRENKRKRIAEEFFVGSQPSELQLSEFEEHYEETQIVEPIENYINYSMEKMEQVQEEKIETKSSPDSSPKSPDPQDFVFQFPNKV